jgi:hypothetical protein
VQVSPVLVRVSDGTTRWAGEPTVVTPADPFAVQGALAAEVAEALDVALAPAERTRLATAGPRDTAAFAAVERGRRIYEASDTLSLPERRRRALREFEFAYQRDSRSAEAWGLAADALLRMGQEAGNTALVDSAAGLARRAVALDPGHFEAVSTLGLYEQLRDRTPAARALVGRAVRAHPSSAELRILLALVQYQTGDTVPAWPTALAALRLAPRSTVVLDEALRVALSLRRYDEARGLVARRRALDPTAARGDLLAAHVAAAVGDSLTVARALRAYQAKGGRVRASDRVYVAMRTPLVLMRWSDRATGDALLAGTPAIFGAETGMDSLSVYHAQAQLLLRRGDSARARPLQARAYGLVRRLSDAAQPGKPQANVALPLAWFAATRGDRAAADGALALYAATYGANLRDEAGGLKDARLTCMRAEVAGLLGDVPAMLAPLRRCLTMANGHPVAALRTEPAFAQHAADPRVRALAAELAAAEQRARTTPVPAAR